MKTQYVDFWIIKRSKMRMKYTWWLNISMLLTTTNHTLYLRRKNPDGCMIPKNVKEAVWGSQSMVGNTHIMLGNTKLLYTEMIALKIGRNSLHQIMQELISHPYNNSQLNGRDLTSIIYQIEDILLIHIRYGEENGNIRILI